MLQEDIIFEVFMFVSNRLFKNKMRSWWLVMKST